jgi:cell division protein FtsZ
VIDDSLGDEVRVTVIAAGFEAGTPTHKKLEPTAFGSAPRSSNGNGGSASPPQKTGSGYGTTPSNGFAADGAPAQPVPATAHQAGTLPPAAPSYSMPYTAPPPRTPEAARREASGFGLPNTDAAEHTPAQPAAATLPPAPPSAPPAPAGSSYSSFSSSLLPSASATASDPDDDVDVPSFMKR